ncbi:hypothetical protein [Streptomyces sp. NPDC014995]|uniref:hypothetical protein n=1 Tax=Streptomyces sp. NPDC014995 TaxID=3364936 RepID=UPI00370324E6
MRGRLNGQRAATPVPLPGDGGTATAPAAPWTPFDHRVRVLVEIRDDPDEIALAKEVVGGFGWPMREPRPGEGPTGGVTVSHVAQVVEVRLLGARRGIAAQAAHELDRLARSTGLSLVVREAALIRRPESPGQEWEVVPVTVSPRDRVRGFFNGDKDDRPEHVIRVPEGSPSPTPDIASLSTALDPQPFVPADHRLRRLTFRPSMAALLVVGLGFLGTAGLGGLIHLTNLAPGTAPNMVRALALALSLTLAVTVGLFGLAHAVRYSAALRLALPWTIPLALPVLLAGVPRVGGVVQNRYLAHFDLPGSPVTTDWWDSLRAGVFTCLCALAGFLLLVGTAGFVHRLGARAGAPFSHSLVIGALYGTAAALALSVVAISRVDAAAADDRHTLADGRVPDGLYGLHPDFVCVRPTDRTPPVYGTLPPATRPVVTFGPSGDRISLWDPKTGQSLSMRLEDAVFVPAETEKGRAVCPQAR